MFVPGRHFQLNVTLLVRPGAYHRGTQVRSGLTHNPYTWLERPAREEHVSLFGPFVSYGEEEKFYEYGWTQGPML